MSNYGVTVAINRPSQTEIAEKEYHWTPDARMEIPDSYYLDLAVANAAGAAPKSVIVSAVTQRRSSTAGQNRRDNYCVGIDYYYTTKVVWFEVDRNSNPPHFPSVDLQIFL